jgi:hypothetical protein
MSHDDGDERTTALLKSLEARLTSLEDGREKSLFKRITQNASASALFLGLVLSAISLYDALVVKPEEARIARISQFNEAVNSAARMRQDMLKLQTEISNPMMRMQMMSLANPQIMNNISTARAILRNLADEDVEIPQLIVLITEAAAVNDMASVGAFIVRAVSKENVPPLLRSEAKRYEGKYLFSLGNFEGARSSYQESMDILGPSPMAAGAKAYVLQDWALFEFTMGDCTIAGAKLRAFSDSMRSPTMPPEARVEMTASFRTQLLALQEQHCPLPPDLDDVLPEMPG